MRMSSGPSSRKLKPRSGGPSSSDETPRSKSRPATAPRSTPSSASKCSSRWKLPCARRTRSPNGASRAPARRSASGSRSRPTSRAAGPRASSAAACPPRPTVASTNSPPRSGASRSSDSRSSTGRCSTGAGAEDGPPSLKGPRSAAMRRASDPSLAESSEVLFGEGLLVQAAGEAVAVPHHQVIEVGADHHLAAHAGALAQDRRDQQAPLVVQAGLLAVIVDPFEVARLHPVGGRHAAEPRLDLFPDRQRVEPRRIARDRRREQVGPVALLDRAAEIPRDLEPPLVVDLGWSTPSEHGLLPSETVVV